MLDAYCMLAVGFGLVGLGVGLGWVGTARQNKYCVLLYVVVPSLGANVE
jgi:hypothetical protein